MLLVAAPLRSQISLWPVDISDQASAYSTLDSVPSQICFPSHSLRPFLSEWHCGQECSQQCYLQELNSANNLHTHQQENESTDCGIFMPGNTIQQRECISSSCNHHMDESEKQCCLEVVSQKVADCVMPFQRTNTKAELNNRQCKHTPTR